MTFSYSTPESPAPFTLTPSRAAIKTAASLRVWAAVERVILWMLSATLARHSRASAARFHRSARFRLVFVSLELTLKLLPGTRLQKASIVKRLLQTACTRMRALRKRAIEARNRRCWKWGGAIRNNAGASFFSAPITGNETASFDAMIPD